MKARIYKPAKNVMQSGRAHAGTWLLEYESKTRRDPDPLMGWGSASNTLGQVRLKFSSLSEAKAYAEKEGLPYQIISSGARKIKPRNYGDAFRYIPVEGTK